MKKGFKSLLLFPLAAAAISSFTACSVDTSDSLVVWTFTNEISKLVRDYYTPATGKKVKVVIKDSVTTVVTELMDIWDEGIDVPDVIALESAVVKDKDTQPYLLPLNDIENTEQMYDYTKSVASDAEGNLFGLSWQATPGGFFYKKRVADAIGVTEAEMATYLSTWGGFMELAEICHDHSVAIVSSITEPTKVFLSDRENSWVEDNVLQLEKVMFGPSDDFNCFDTVKDLHKKDYTHQTSERGAAWFADIDTDDCLGYFASCWGLNFDLIERASVKSGWRMCKAPVDYFKGGTWLAIPKKSSRIERAKDFIKYVTTNEDFLTKRCKSTGDFMNNKNVMNEVIQDYSCSFLDGQNHFEILVDVADKINGDLISPYDAYIDQIFNSQLALYAKNAPAEPKRESYDTEEEYLAAYENYLTRLETSRTKYKNDFRSGVKNKFATINTNSYPN